MSAITELSTFLESAGHGTRGTNLFEGLLPETPDSARAVVPTTGFPDIRSFNGVEYEVRRYQVYVRDAVYATADSRAEGMYASLRAVANQALSGTFYLTIDAVTPPYLLERDENGRVVLAFNIEAWRKP